MKVDVTSWTGAPVILRSGMEEARPQETSSRTTGAVIRLTQDQVTIEAGQDISFRTELSSGAEWVCAFKERRVAKPSNPGDMSISRKLGMQGVTETKFKLSPPDTRLQQSCLTNESETMSSQRNTQVRSP